MRERKNILDYMAQTMIAFGASMLALALFCELVGEEARGFSTMFALGKEGIPSNTILQFLLNSVCIMVIRFLFFSDRVFRKMSIAGRTIGMLASVIALIGVFAYCFGWFPVDDPKCWACFLVSFGICFVIAWAVSAWKESLDNRQLEEGLRHLKEQQGTEQGH
ncbi:MAG: hypothetical protein NC305_16670 [Lachnospiraceae bacterium]|nr:hypothetical protein [Butyrivibrio sp.]MCM1344991.1 hypothetical protein [Muribaculaceae bacterium]MCM1412158.1 hypothetical protein [Lachnospiraceae bacterium]